MASDLLYKIAMSTRLIHKILGIMLVTTVTSITALTDDTNTTPLNILWLPLTRPLSLNLISSELSTHFKVTTITPPTPEKDQHPNPFYTVKRDFWVDHYLPNPHEALGPVPLLSKEDAKWFSSLQNHTKDTKIFITGGHNVISEGFHNDSETHFMFLPTLLNSLQVFKKEMAPVFENIRLVILFACNTLTDLEPHGVNGEYLTPEQIRQSYFSSEAGKAEVIGSASQNNTLEFYRARLAREYGPLSQKYEYTRDPKEEKCFGPGPYENCDITNVDRILPDRGLMDGTHRYNNSNLMKKLFPNAYLILGFNSASESEEMRVKMLKEALDKSRIELKQTLPTNLRTLYGESVLNTIMSDSTPTNIRKLAIEILRKNWTLSTYKNNRQRPAGSITPAFPDLDKNGVFNVYIDSSTPRYRPYENREMTLSRPSYRQRK